MKFLSATCLALVIVLAALQGASAQSCSVSAASGNYGSVSVLSGSAVDTTTTFTVSCSGILFATVGVCAQFVQGSPSGAGTARYLASGGATLVHQLYSNSSRTTIWGSWGYGGAAVFGSGGVAQNIGLGLFGTGSATFTVYGRVIGSQQSTAPGTYVWTTTAPVISYGYGSTTCASQPGSGTDTPGTSTWTASVPADCNISTSPINFGTISALTSNRDATGSLSIQCTSTTPYSVGINTGSNANGAQRRMRLGATANYINYNLYTDIGRTSAWTSSTSPTSCTSGAGTCILSTGTGSSQTVNVYARVPPQGAPPVGTYTDTVIVSITY